jgi:hypothetical protein
MGKKGKAKSRKHVATRDLAPRDGKQVKGGRKAGGTQQEYLVVKMEDILITG